MYASPLVPSSCTSSVFNHSTVLFAMRAQQVGLLRAHLMTGLAADTQPEMAKRRLAFPALRISSLRCEKWWVQQAGPPCTYHYLGLLQPCSPSRGRVTVKRQLNRRRRRCVYMPTELSKCFHCQRAITEGGRDWGSTSEDTVNLHVDVPRQVESSVSSYTEWDKQQTCLPLIRT